MYIVEVKRGKVRMIRQVLAQALEYAATIWSTYRDNIEALIEKFQAHKNCEFLVGGGGIGSGRHR